MPPYGRGRGRGQIAKQVHDRRWRLVKNKKASYWCPYRPISEIDLDEVLGCGS